MTTKRKPLAHRKFFYRLEYRFEGRWIPIGGRHMTRDQAADYASTSYSCKEYGYQIKRIQNPRYRAK